LTDKSDLPLIFVGDELSPALEESLVDTLVTKCETLQARVATVETILVSLIAAGKRWKESGPSTEETYADDQAMIAAIETADEAFKG